MTSITWAGSRCVQELTTILAPQNRTQGSCEYHWSVLIFMIMLSQVKWAVDEKLLHTDIDEMGGYAAAIRRVLEHKSLRDKFCGVRAELAELGYTGVEITQEGIQLTREEDQDQDTANPDSSC